MRGLHRVLSLPEYALIMYRYAWICLNNAEHDFEYAGIYLKKQSAEYAIILNVSDAGFV